ncbi:hypothetical protein TTHERM_00353250 (macronuclear) [Tetrahymena thermophila SB210]|uniref:Uncharacterized protein n=1 Tax=Tetrahymena thermophila (strain SB210) TaxID=312017 RepID=I7M9U6_TETTS|nr:hypothetical protein TTHERM_00353250 [Tetrahymena thermophila SB210]EAS02839.1 hypothetical protein TTHERM_00353250 [Tetrahymena thermophila SB210]|eukprot:XP_001023084.1 hypothetical protein TTHERM_00353250 [Tetrahymena thermophila SB210]
MTSIQKISNKLSFKHNAWEILDQKHLQNFIQIIKTCAASFKEISISLDGDNIRDKSVLISLINQIKFFTSAQNLEINFGYLNILEVDAFKTLFSNILELKQLNKLSLVFDTKVVGIRKFEEYQLISSLFKQLPQLDILELKLHKDNLIDFGNSGNLVSLFIQQTQIKILKLELKDNNLKNTFMVNLTKDFSKLFQLQQLDLTLKNSESPIDLKLIIQNLLLLNLETLFLTVERCQIYEIESNICEINNQSQNLIKYTSIRFVEIENIDNVIKYVLSNINRFENFYFYLDKIKVLENLQTESQTCRDELSNLIHFNFEILNTIVSQSFISNINRTLLNVFKDIKQLKISLNKYKMQLENFDESTKNFKFVYDYFNNEEFLNQIQELNFYQKQNQCFKILQISELSSIQFAHIPKIISLDEIYIKQTINQECLNGLDKFLDSLDGVDLKIFQLELHNNQYQQFNIDQLVKVLTKFRGVTNYTIDTENIRNNRQNKKIYYLIEKSK